jgi:hypothetical protein
MEKLQGKRLQVLVEGVLPESQGTLLGTADRYVTVELCDQIDSIGRLIYVIADKIEDRHIKSGMVPGSDPPR